VRFGIPDFRLAPDPYISFDDEVAKIDRLLSRGATTFQQLLSEYYDLSPENPPALNRHYVAAMEGAPRRGAALLEKLRRRYPGSPRERLLDLGCGTAGLGVAALAAGYARVVGVDVALRWLVMGRQRLAEEAVIVPLICANAEALPFRPESFDAVVADAVLEHVRDSKAMRDQVLRVLGEQGSFMFTTNNRYSILPEPHVRIPGFGLLPRAWMEPVAMAVRKTPYRVRLHSRRQLRRLFLGIADVELPVYEPGELGSRNERLRAIWSVLGSVGPARAILGPVVPQYFIYGSKGSG
jgi:SAM-dependent methyltransferase